MIILNSDKISVSERKREKQEKERTRERERKRENKKKRKEKIQPKDFQYFWCFMTKALNPALSLEASSILFLD
ncbi:hypothetical protein M1146_07645 [Patescibacteria group bacterium]|nr:hypothetical protein [Patescibacteria group bacterium]